MENLSENEKKNSPLGTLTDKKRTIRRSLPVSMFRMEGEEEEYELRYDNHCIGMAANEEEAREAVREYAESNNLVFEQIKAS